jgi:hypothetical protein
LGFALLKHWKTNELGQTDMTLALLVLKKLENELIRSFPNSFSKKTRTSSGRGKKKLAVLSSPTKLEEDLSHTHKKITLLSLSPSIHKQER